MHKLDISNKPIWEWIPPLNSSKLWTTTLLAKFPNFLFSILRCCWKPRRKIFPMHKRRTAQFSTADYRLIARSAQKMFTREMASNLARPSSEYDV